MQKSLLSFLCIAVLVSAGAVFGQFDEQHRAGTYPEGPNPTKGFIEAGGMWYHPDRSGLGVFNKMEVRVSDIAWNGRGAVDIPFNINQRAHVTIVIYRVGSNETGITGPNGAWIRLAPQPMYVNRTPMQDVGRGNNVIRWDGLNWDGNPAGPGTYEFDIIALNDFDANVVGTAQSAAWGPHSVDTKVSPPETWSPFQETPSNVCYMGTVDTDYIANPTAFDLWTISAIGPDEERNMSGNQVDDLDSRIHWASRRRDNEALGLLGGIIKLQRNDAAKDLEAVTDFGDNGLAQNRGDSKFVVPVRNMIYTPANGGPNGLSAVEVYDKSSGERVKEIDMFEWFSVVREDSLGNPFLAPAGPNILDANQRGLVMSSHNTDHYVQTDFDGNVLWVNTTGDGIKDWISAEAAAALGITSHANGANAVTVGLRSHWSGSFSTATDQHNQIGYNFASFGRDGAGLFLHTFDPSYTPFGYSSEMKHLIFVDSGSAYDGMYPGSNHDITGEADGFRAGEGTGSLMYYPFGIFVGRLGAGVTAVEETGAAGTPESYTLSEAYPNPFNPETTIEFAVPSDVLVKLDVYNSVGQQVASLVNDELTAGSYKTTWDAHDETGEQVSTGVYFYRMQAGDFTDTRTMTLLK